MISDPKPTKCQMAVKPGRSAQDFPFYLIGPCTLLALLTLAWCNVLDLDPVALVAGYVLGWTVTHEIQHRREKRERERRDVRMTAATYNDMLDGICRIAKQAQAGPPCKDYVRMTAATYNDMLDGTCRIAKQAQAGPPCKDCGGVGRISDDIACPACHGTGVEPETTVEH